MAPLTQLFGGGGRDGCSAGLRSARQPPMQSRVTHQTQVDLPAAHSERGWRVGGDPPRLFRRGAGGARPIERMTSKVTSRKTTTRRKSLGGKAAGATGPRSERSAATLKADWGRTVERQCTAIFSRCRIVL